MRRATVLVALFLAAACATQKSGLPNFPSPDVEIGQLTSGGDLLLSGGPVNLSYQLAVTNNADAQITLKRIELRTVGGGLYQLPNRSQNVALTIAPHSESSVNFSMWGIGYGSIRTHVYEPTTLRGVAYFDTPSGPLQKFFTATLDVAGQ